LSWLDAVYKALVLLVIACPCALVISTPVTVVSGLAAGARRGILVKGGSHLEAARGLKAIALDKTGTITEGRPRLVEWQPWAGHDRDEAQALAASLVARSDHPVSKAIAEGLPAAARAAGSREPSMGARCCWATTAPCTSAACAGPRWKRRCAGKRRRAAP
jgi:Cd2+/Zn2+-exporting ATPase